MSQNLFLDLWSDAKSVGKTIFRIIWTKEMNHLVSLHIPKNVEAKSMQDYFSILILHLPLLP